MLAPGGSLPRVKHELGGSCLPSFEAFTERTTMARPSNFSTRPPFNGHGNAI
jgi:hypothetical protein